jgi:hypothetical protein
MCEDETHNNKGKSVRKDDCVLCTPSRLCIHHKQTCSECNPGITDKFNQITRHKKERETFHGLTAAQFMALTPVQQEKVSTDFMYLRDKAIMETISEKKRVVIRNVKKQVELLSCDLPTAYVQIKAFLEPFKALIFPKGRPSTLAINGMACSGGVKSTTKKVLANVVRSTHKGPFTSTDGLYRKFTDEAEVDLQSLVEDHKKDIAKGRTFVDKKGDAVLGCVFYSKPTEVLSAGFAEGRMYERALILWIREQSAYCKDLNSNNGGGGATPKNVATCGGSAWFTVGPTEVV